MASGRGRPKLMFRTSVEQIAATERLADASGLTRSDVIRQALAEYLDRANHADRAPDPR
ncbi:MAG: CopG family transcriptional regulator [Rhodothermaceae bacterium]|nr:CopG family transcriptional regulator [Rhodothermaceae bacterium]